MVYYEVLFEKSNFTRNDVVFSKNNKAFPPLISFTSRNIFVTIFSCVVARKILSSYLTVLLLILCNHDDSPAKPQVLAYTELLF